MRIASIAATTVLLTVTASILLHAQAVDTRVAPVALDSAWSWAVEGGIGSDGLSAQFLHASGTHHAWTFGLTSAAVRIGRTETRSAVSESFNSTYFVEGQAVLSVGLRRYRATATRVVPFSDLGLTAGYTSLRGITYRSVGPYVGIGTTYFADRHIAVGGEVALSTARTIPNRDYVTNVRDRESLFIKASVRLACTVWL